MKLKKSNTPSDPLVASAKLHFEAATEHIRKGCAEAIITGMHLIAIHKRTNGNGHGGNRVAGASAPRGALEKGWRGTLEEIDIAETTARRWMNAAANAAVRLTLITTTEEMAGEIPEHGTPRWETWESEMRNLADGMSMSRLLVGQLHESTEDHRYERLISASEDGRDRAIQLLQDVADGKYTLAKAIKALGSQEAYDLLRSAAGDGEKVRKDAVYLAYDATDKIAVGLIPKAFTTLRNGFSGWDSYDEDAKEQTKTLFLALIKDAPLELTQLLKRI